MVWAAPAPVAIALCLRELHLAALIIGAVLSATEQHADLGVLVCDMEPETITASDPSVLENLKLCPALTGAQRDALNTVLLGGGTVYGDPSSWDLRSLQNLGPLVLALNQTTLSLVAEAAREAFGRSIVAAYSSQGRSQREKSLTLLRAFTAASASSHPRLKRSADRERFPSPQPREYSSSSSREGAGVGGENSWAGAARGKDAARSEGARVGCLSAPITASTFSDSSLLISYDTSEQFDLCLSNEVLKPNLKLLLEQPLTVEYLRVVKKKLEQIYPSGIPEEQLKLLGTLSRQYTAEEISWWPVTSSDTLLALLDPSDGKWEAPQVQQLLSRYLALRGTLTGPLLQKIGGRNLCNLQEEQISQISPEAIRTAGQLNISSCSQTKKDQLYRKAQEAFAGQAGSTRAYYCQIWPYLGGAPAKDLKDLAKAGVAIDMDIDTFLALNPEELQKLSVTDVKNLLGENLPYLKEAENETSVMRWLKRQSQRELDCTLGIGLQGGTAEPSPTGTATPPHPTTSASITPTAAVLPTVPTPIAISSHPTTNSSSGPHKPPTPSAISPTPPNSTPPRAYTAAPTAAVSPAATSTARPALTTGSVVPCSIHQSATSNKATPPAVTLLTTVLAAVNPNATSPSSVPPPALTHGATTTTSVVTSPAVTTRNTSTPLGSVNPPAPGGTANPAPATRNTATPSTHNAPSTLLPNSPSAPAATAATETNLPPHKPTPILNSTVSTQESVISSTPKTTTLACKTSAPPAFLGPSSTTTSSETTKETPAGVPEPPRPTPGGYINLQPEPGSGTRLSSCLVHILTTAVGSSLLRALL
ncbi:mesothelin-like protein [Gymnogyps californianus]|uniref:mesothelin-like protein n=1 Tax=Gymnogyps californianus TaxID=33616 RepID=UPI0021CA197D|nr:mesothelin-like protein [Gymnogyps californianus]